MSASQVTTHSFRSDDADQISQYIGKIYAGNVFRPTGIHSARHVVDIGGAHWKGIGVYDVAMEMSHHFHTDEPRQNYLFMACNRGGLTYSNGSSTVPCGTGDVMAVSATDTSHCQSGTEGFDHISVILDAYDVNDFVARWLGHPLEKPIHFELSALPPATAIQWNLAVSCLQKALLMSPVPETLMHALYEHMLKLVATGHRNSYSNLMTSDHCVAEQQARAALSMIEADPMRWGTLGSIAITLRCAIASLENGILRLTGRTARDLFFEARLRGVHRALSKGGERTFVGTLRQFGFNLSDQFILAYRLRFGEPPSVTYRKNCHALEASDLRLDARDVFSRAAIDKFVDLHLSSSISLADIATHMGESKVWMMRVFKAQFGVTPTQYIIERRLEKARWMLVNTSDSILSIALQCGFAGQSYFTTQIKRRYGVTPRQLRISSAS